MVGVIAFAGGVFGLKPVAAVGLEVDFEESVPFTTVEEES